MRPLARVMVAPNGARLTRADHPALPVTVSEVVDCAIACHAAGADGLHAHVRDQAQRHVLDAGLYAELLAEMRQKLPDFYVQITTEAVGRYSPAQQRRLVEELRPAAVSIGLREITADKDEAVTRRFFAFCAEAGIGVQHILYDSADAGHLAQLLGQGVVPRDHLKLLLVLGRYAANQTSSPSEVAGFVGEVTSLVPAGDWAVCAFGQHETACLTEAMRLGGKARIGFENNRQNMDGSIAANNAERVSELVAQIAELAKVEEKRI